VRVHQNIKIGFNIQITNIFLGQGYEKIVSFAFVMMLMVGSPNANAFFFFWLPGSVTGKIADAFTGAEGENCVADSAKVGDLLTVNGKLMKVKSISGTSSRCVKPEMPIRAMLVENSETPTLRSTDARIEMPQGWSQRTLTDLEKATGVVLGANNKTIDSGYTLTTYDHTGIVDFFNL